MFEKGKPRHPKAGRKKGTVNKSQLAVREICAELGANPIEFMALVMLDKLPKTKTIYEVTLEMRINCAKELAKYIFPQLRSLEVSGAIKVTQTPAEELAQKAIEMAKNGDSFSTGPLSS
ncbi:hypothetical protein LCGC14_1364640 [marine sediment metagenome]|uniref:Uncharacterized protein n=1 Tax=marine sediment metagenome TaxID=412755 RepID=A0A0F9K7M4_9ZZZZ